MRTTIFRVITIATVIAAMHPARADDAAADAKFQSGMQHFKLQDYATACKEFEESEQLGPNPSTKYYLAKCALQSSKPARAWNLFKQAAAAMPDAKMRAVAEQGANDLTAQVGLVTLVGTQPAPKLEVRMDDEVITVQVLVGQPIAVEPGPHVLRATAPDRDVWKREFTIAKGESLSFSVPALPAISEPAVITPPKPTPDPPIATTTPSPGPVPRETPEGPRNNRRWLAYGALGVGAVGIGVGAMFGILASSKWNDAKQGCTEANGAFASCPAGADQLRKDAQSRATLSTVGFVVGGAALGASVVLYLVTRRESATPRMTRRTRITPTPSGFALIGRF